MARLRDATSSRDNSLIYTRLLAVHDAFAREDPASEWVQVTDEETGRMVAAANWRRESGVQKAENGTYDEEKAEKEAPQTLSLFAAGAKEWAKVKAEFFPSQNHLSKSIILPAHLAPFKPFPKACTDHGIGRAGCLGRTS